MDTSSDHDISAHLAGRLRLLRLQRGLTLDALAQRTGVSRSMLSLVERCESSPTAVVLDRLAAGLGITLASLFADEGRREASPLSRRADQRVWRDPGSGYLRRSLSAPACPSPISLVEVVLPAEARIAYDSGAAPRGISQQVWMIDGSLDLTIGEITHRLSTGDCLTMRIDEPIVFRNPGGSDARYLVALAPDYGGPDRSSSDPESHR
ncbi:MAG: XRE family transcriptional regulator [Microvirga sp.]